MSPAIDADAVLDATGAPDGLAHETLDVRDLGPPKPLARTLERLTELDGETALVQLNDRAPQHLYPELDDRGYAHETVEHGGATVTVVWEP